MFDAATAAECRTALWAVLAARGTTADDPATWTRPAVRVPCPEGSAFDAIADAPELVEACDRLIGAGRWRRLDGAGGDVPLRFPSEQWPGDTGYHIEGTWWGGDEYWTSVTSPGRGLTALILFGDVDPDEAPTRLVVGSHRFAAPVLAAAGPLGMGGGAAADRLRPSVLCRQVAHATGHAGDIYLCHPFLVHTPTWPHRGRRPRMISQPRINAPDGSASMAPTPRPSLKPSCSDWRPRPERHRLTIVFRTAGNETVLSMVRAGMGVAVLPWLAVHGADVWSDDQLRVHELRAPPAREIYLHWPAGRTQSPLAARTIEIAVKVADELSTQQ